MGRKQSNTVDYFPHFAEQGKTLFILKSRFGNDGYAFWFQLLEILCKEEDHLYNFQDESAWQYLLSRTGVNEITGTEILKLLANLGKIDPEMWQHKIIWCENLVLNLESVYKKRGRLLPKRPGTFDHNNDTATEISPPVTDMPISATEIPQSKVKESKVEESKGEESRVGENPTPTPSTQGILDKVKFCYESGWGMNPNGKSSAQLRDLAKELSVANCPFDYIDEAFKEAARMNTYSVSYVRKILLAWLGIEEVKGE